MTETSVKTRRAQTSGEELANAISHGLGFLLALVSLPILVWYTAEHGRILNLVAVVVFSITMMALYLVSTLYHAVPAGRVKHWLNRLDHAAIYVFIAGSYTPFLLGVLRGGWGWSLLGVVWGLATLGVAAKLLNRLVNPIWSTGLYVALGWLFLVALGPLMQRMSNSGLAWLVAGGVAYTAGAIVFLFDTRLRFAHFIWHLFVMSGSTCHFFAVLWHAQ